MSVSIRKRMAQENKQKAFKALMIEAAAHFGATYETVTAEQITAYGDVKHAARKAEMLKQNKLKRAK
jgi:hypothetical protein